ncbi:MAG: formylglycine-generating enzyme family protein [bacterium]
MMSVKIDCSMKWYLSVHLLIFLLLLPLAGYAFQNTLNMQMVEIQEGVFSMGSSLTQGGEDESPVHKVQLKKFHMSETEVTVDQWGKFCEEGETDWDRWEDVKKYSPNGTYPICFVSWEDAKDFCDWLSEKEEKTYRLPTEAEWEYAGRGGLVNEPYPWGGQEPGATHCNFGDKQERDKEKDLWADPHIDDGFAYCSPVKTYPPNKFGLYDMAGNVWEWCHDWYCSTYYQESPGKDPPGPPSGKLKALRGGAWAFHKEMLQVSNRFGIDPKTSAGFIGFRIVAVEE